MLIAEPREMTAEDTAKMAMIPPSRHQITADKLRRSHHRVARLSARGLRNCEIAQLTGRSEQSIYLLLASPAMKNLVAYYSKMVDDDFAAGFDEYREALGGNMLSAERLIAERLEEAEESGDPLPLKDLVAISRDAADRLGYGKKSQVTQVKVDFASELERAIARSGKTEEVKTLARRTEDA